MRASGLAGSIMLFLVACVLAACALQPEAHEEALERVDDGIYAMRLSARGMDEATVVPARVSFISGPRGVVVVDSGLGARDGESILSAVERTAHAPVRLLVLTHASQEAVFGASAFASHGIPVAMSGAAARLMAARCATCLERLRLALGDAAMAGTRLIAPGRLLQDGEVIADIGRPLRVIAPAHSSAPGAIALADEATGTIIAGSIALVHAVPDIRDGEAAGWHAALDRIGATGCRHLVPAFGRVGSCADVPAFRGYLDALEARVASLRAHGAELGEMEARAALPAYAGWDRYATLHTANAEREYLRLERDDLAKP